MNKINKNGKDVGLSDLNIGLVSNVTRKDSTDYLETELEFPKKVNYKGELYHKLIVRTIYQPTNTVPIRIYIQSVNGKGRGTIDEKWRTGTQALSQHNSILMELIRTYQGK